LEPKESITDEASKSRTLKMDTIGEFSTMLKELQEQYGLKNLQDAQAVVLKRLKEYDAMGGKPQASAAPPLSEIAQDLRREAPRPQSRMASEMAEMVELMKERAMLRMYENMAGVSDSPQRQGGGLGLDIKDMMVMDMMANGRAQQQLSNVIALKALGGGGEGARQQDPQLAAAMAEIQRVREDSDKRWDEMMQQRHEAEMKDKDLQRERERQEHDLRSEERMAQLVGSVKEGYGELWAQTSSMFEKKIPEISDLDKVRAAVESATELSKAFKEAGLAMGLKPADTEQAIRPEKEEFMDKVDRVMKSGTEMLRNVKDMVVGAQEVDKARAPTPPGGMPAVPPGTPPGEYLFMTPQELNEMLAKAARGEMPVQTPEQPRQETPAASHPGTDMPRMVGVPPPSPQERPQDINIYIKPPEDFLPRSHIGARFMGSREQGPAQPVPQVQPSVGAPPDVPPIPVRPTPPPQPDLTPTPSDEVAARDLRTLTDAELLAKYGPPPQTAPPSAATPPVPVVPVEPTPPPESLPEVGEEHEEAEPPESGVTTIEEFEEVETPPHEPTPEPIPEPAPEPAPVEAVHVEEPIPEGFPCPGCGRICKSQIGLSSHMKACDKVPVDGE